MDETDDAAVDDSPVDPGADLSDLWDAETCAWHIDYDGSAGSTLPWTLVLEWSSEYGNPHGADWVTYTWQFYGATVDEPLARRATTATGRGWRMGESTGIAWTDHTFNPWWGCTKVSAACDSCYAESFAKRTGNDVWGVDKPRRLFGDAHWSDPVRWNAAAEKAGRVDLVFCASMADVFEARADLDEHRSRLWSLIESTPHLIWQLLTKRPEQVCRKVPSGWLAEWPVNVWIGTTVEDQAAAELRIPRLLDIPARVRFMSCEPLLGPVDLRPWLRRVSDVVDARSAYVWDTSHRIGWVIVGGESGNGFRAMDVDHAQAIVDECRHWDVPVFFKQWGGRTPTAGGCELDGIEIKEFPPEARRGETVIPFGRML